MSESEKLQDSNMLLFGAINGSTSATLASNKLSVVSVKQTEILGKILLNTNKWLQAVDSELTKLNAVFIGFSTVMIKLINDLGGFLIKMGGNDIANVIWDQIALDRKSEMDSVIKIADLVHNTVGDLIGQSWMEEMTNLGKALGNKKTQKGTKGLKGAVKSIVVGGPKAVLMGMAMEAMGDVMSPLTALMMLWKPFEPIFTLLGGMLKKSITPAVIWLTEALKPLYEWMAWVVGIIWGESPGLIPGFIWLWDVISKVVDIIYDNLLAGFTLIIGGFNTLTNGFNTIVGVFATVSSAFAGLSSSPITMLTMSLNLFFISITSLSTLITGSFSTAWNTFKGIFGTLKTLFKNTFNAIASMINEVIEWIQKIPGMGGIKKVPTFHRGGTMPDDGLAFLREGETIHTPERDQEIIDELRKLNKKIQASGWL